MKSFDYAEPRTEAEAVALLSEHAGRAEGLAGGTDLVGLMKKMIIKRKIKKMVKIKMMMINNKTEFLLVVAHLKK